MKKIIERTILPVFIVMIFASCHVNSQYINSEADLEDAEKVTTQLFQHLKTKEYDKTSDLFTKKFFEVSSKEKLLQMFSATSKKLGDLQYTEVESWQTKRVEGSNPSANYLLVYKNTYEKYKARETLTLTRDTDGKIRIVGYNINSDGFLDVNN